jgi:Uma2 family endonuclease
MRLVFVRESDLELLGGDVTTAIFGDGQQMSEAEFFALDEAPERIELFDGSLHVTPSPSYRHQHIAGELIIALKPAARRAGLYAFEAVNVRLEPRRIVIPDLVITSHFDFASIGDAMDMRLVCEIISPSNASTDKVLKMHYYATAGIPWYLIVEQDTAALHLYKLAGTTYVEHSVTKVGEILELTDPIVATIDPADLMLPL